MFSGTPGTQNFPGSNATDLGNAANLYAVLTGRVTAITGNARLDPNTGKYVYIGTSRAGRTAAGSRCLRSGQLADATEPVDQCRRAVCGATAVLRVERQLFHGDARRRLGHLRKRAWLQSERPDAGDVQSLQARRHARHSPTYQNLGEGVEAYQTDWDNIAPSIGVNWTPGGQTGVLRTLLGQQGDTSFSGGFSRRLRASRDERLHGRVQRESGRVDQRHAQHRQRQPHGAAAVPRRVSRSRRRSARRSRRRSRPAVCSKRRSIR